MKNRLSQFNNLILLKRNEKLHGGNCYVLSSEAVASNLYFETKRDIIRAHKLINRHLSNVMDVIDYLFTPNGFVLVVTIHNEEDILEYIEDSNYNSIKIKNALKSKNTAVILSECMRYMISGITRITNRYNKRLGGVVRRNFSRYIFGDIDIALEVMKKMKIQQIKLCCQRKRYRPNMRKFDLNGDLSNCGDVFLCTKSRLIVRENTSKMRECISLVSKSYVVLRGLIEKTFQFFYPIKDKPSKQVF